MKKQLSKPKVPSYLTSFADMMTILLTFFILLYSYSTERNFGVIEQRAEAFDKAIKALGLPGLMGSDVQSINLGQTRPKFAIFPGYEDSQKSKKRDLVSHLPFLKEVTVEPFQRRRQSVRISLVPYFAKGQSRLQSGHREFLTALVPNLAKRSHINVIGIAANEKANASANLRLALARALNTMQFLHQHGQIPMARMRPLAQTSASGDERCVMLSFDDF